MRVILLKDAENKSKGDILTIFRKDKSYLYFYDDNGVYHSLDRQLENKVFKFVEYPKWTTKQGKKTAIDELNDNYLKTSIHFVKTRIERIQKLLEFFEDKEKEDLSEEDRDSLIEKKELLMSELKEFKRADEALTAEKRYRENQMKYRARNR